MGLVSLLAGAAHGQLELESGGATGGGGRAEGGNLAAVVVAGEANAGESGGGSFTVIGGMQAMPVRTSDGESDPDPGSDPDLLFADGFEPLGG